MTIRWNHLLLPIAGGSFAALAVPVDFWDGSKGPLLTALSVIAAGVLVRLARGFPFTNADQFELDEARGMAEAIKRSILALRGLIVMVFLAMGSLVVAAALTGKLTALAVNSPYLSEAAVASAVSGLVGALLTYVFVRVFAVISGDVSLVDLQTQLLIKSVQRKQAERFSKSVDTAERPAFKNPEGYGKIVQ